ncbi:D-isomer specific 2-hydroxyacid dehydrogenase family protein [Erysipelothrix rhusiopathiae]|uniref:D-isomer specific 2-hydroxyacid dehydrogenase family protein n=1 Tax=Erysipelothrix rhusiopathiae TaxID=1648 RepID=UPI00033483DB|nr:D-isomer specific 2-hydroxyacid dehydrogenase family protein [Erysipelothrix rhusiopathiae]AGN25067.1 D-lactate dehydrogenase [Erysipelothrix rhusiopathiae SY1027]AMS10207.1 lactate dehydrogenase [Erysipelothrix rhusiopathiae]AOO67452.1 lactate dehydrogenase [Erysipelothrix rhusiopathiae]AWU40752.1 lactate dehydrogenase [Erysipelothrix rhusiopathiae]MCG4437266.1 D-isomer specific 2-hydroxyacid dehydrogenase family protein [Erysipelothrix rhusiopathiae]
MKLVAYAVRPDEKEAFERFTKEMNIDLKVVNAQMSIDNVNEANGYEAVAFLGNCDASREVLEILAQGGTKYIASRSAGFNNVDMDAVRDLGLKFSNATYSPNCVADFAVMLVLMSLRNMKAIMKRTEVKDYSLPGIQGKEMHNMTFGVIGTGRIGCITARNLSGFGGRIIGYDLYENDSIKDVLTYVDLETLLKEADVITLHAPLIESTHHIINAESLALTKLGVVIVNCARGELIDTDALIKYVENGHIGAVGLDVLEGELGIFHKDHRLSTLSNHQLALLESHKNVIITPHCAFYTDQAVSDMVEVALRSLNSFMMSNESQWEIK